MGQQHNEDCNTKVLADDEKRRFVLRSCKKITEQHDDEQSPNYRHEHRRSERQQQKRNRETDRKNELRTEGHNRRRPDMLVIRIGVRLLREMYPERVGHRVGYGDNEDAA